MRNLYPVRWMRIQFWRGLRRVVRLRASPHAIALGVAIGVFVGVTPTVGLQMLIAVFVATLLGASRLAAVVPVWITNPVTIVPMYSFNYWVGRLLVGGPTVDQFRVKAQHIAGLYATGALTDATWALFNLGTQTLLPLWLGCVLVGIVAGAVAYPVTRRAVVAFRAHVAHKKARRHRRVRDWLHFLGHHGAHKRPEEDKEGPDRPAR